jgi:integrase
MAKDLTIKAIENLKPGEARREIHDGHTRGLHFILQPTGATSWAFRYRFDGRKRKMTLGPYPAIDIPTARKMALDAAQSVGRGQDPGEVKQAAKEAAKAPAQEVNDLFEKVVENYLNKHARKKTGTGTLRGTERMLQTDFGSVFNGRRLSSITRLDVEDVLDGIVDRGSPVQANRSLAALRTMCNWAVRKEIIAKSPCDGVDKPSAETSRDRVLNDDELVLIWWACEKIGWPFGDATQLMLLTAQREAEVGSLDWKELDLSQNEWLLPKRRAKNQVSHLIALSTQAIRILNRLPRIKCEDPDKDLVFTTTGRTPISGWSRAKIQIDREILALLMAKAIERGHDPKTARQIPHWTFHDLRRTAITGMAKLGVPPHIADLILNHKSGEIQGVAAIYNRFEYLDDRRDALVKWGQYVEDLLTGKKPSNAIRVATIDFEASSFGGWPIEVGWMREGDATPRSMLIKPHASWSMTEWCARSAMVHGISPADLEAHGVDAHTVYDAMVEELAGYVVISDCDKYDQRWLKRLSEAAGKPTPFRIESPSLVLPDIAARAGVGLHDAAHRYVANARKPSRHRAGADAEQLMRALFAIVSE